MVWVFTLTEKQNLRLKNFFLFKFRSNFWRWRWLSNNSTRLQLFRSKKDACESNRKDLGPKGGSQKKVWRLAEEHQVKDFYLNQIKTLISFKKLKEAFSLFLSIACLLSKLFEVLCTQLWRVSHRSSATMCFSSRLSWTHFSPITRKQKVCVFFSEDWHLNVIRIAELVSVIWFVSLRSRNMNSVLKVCEQL